MEFGSQAFAGHIIDLKDKFEKKEALTLVTSQFLSYHDFAEKMNSLIVNLHDVMKYNTLEDLMIQVSQNMALVFSAEKVHLWMTDAVSLLS
jgi:hypothetical protein